MTSPGSSPTAACRRSQLLSALWLALSLVGYYWFAAPCKPGKVGRFRGPPEQTAGSLALDPGGKCGKPAALIGAGTLVTSTLGDGLPRIPKGYSLYATIDLSARDVEGGTIARFDLSRAGDAAVLLRLTGVDARYIDVALVPSQGDSIQLMHAEVISPPW